MEQLLVDMAALGKRMENDWDLIREVFVIFSQEAPGRREKFLKALEDRDWDAIVSLAHALKGASGTLVAEPLRQACFELEHAARAVDDLLVPSILYKVLDLLEKTTDRMKEYLASVP